MGVKIPASATDALWQATRTLVLTQRREVRPKTIDVDAFFAALVERERASMYPKQAAAFDEPARYSVIEAGTKTGKTAGGLRWLLKHAGEGVAGHNYWWVAPVYGQSMIAFRRMRRALPVGSFKANETLQTIELVNGAINWFKSGEKPDNLYGEDVYAAVIDEATRLREESWHAVRTTLTATGGPLRVIGNVKGRRNWAYHIARRAEAGAPNMAYHRLIAADAIAAGILSVEEVEDARQQLPESVFRELYLAEPSDDAGNPFGIAHIRACVMPLAEGPAKAYGIDLAKSVDWTVVIGLNAQGQVCTFDRWQGPWGMTLMRIRSTTMGGAALVDSTGVGDPIVEELQQSGDYRGFKFTAQSKQELLEGLAAAIHQRRVAFPDGPIVNELEEFGYEYTRTGVRYTGPEGAHDDCVMALALAWRQLSQGGVGFRWLDL